jgi:sugar phosphate isomerase/epimerase
MVNLGTTTLPLAGWVADPRHPGESRARRLAAIRQIVDGYGLRAVELTLDLGLVFPQVFEAGFYAAVASLQQELGFVCTVHLPFLWIDPSSLNEPLRRTSIDCLRRAVELTRTVEVHTYVLHLWGFTAMQIDAQLQQRTARQAILGALMAQAGRSLSELGEIVEPGDLCVENLEDGLFELALPLIEQHGTSICLDVGHLAYRNGDELDFLAQHQDRIREIHLHDAAIPPPGAPGQIRDHLALGQGQIDYAAFLSRLEELDYKGPVILELNSQADLESSLARLQQVR